MTEKGHEIFVSIVLGLYIMAAVAFECTASTARISTIGIYLVFVTGFIYLLKSRQLQINVHCICLLVLLAYVFFLTMYNHSSMSEVVAYYVLTCTVLCVMAYNLYISVNRERITTVCLLAFIVGSLILFIRIIASYGSLDAILEFSSSIKLERRIGGELINENTLGLYMSNAFFCSLILFGKLKARKPLLAYLILLLSLSFVFMLLQTASKKAILFLILGFAIMILYAVRRFKGGSKLSFLVFSGLFIAGILFLITRVPAFHSVSLRFNDIIELLAGSSGGSDSDQARVRMISEGLNAFLDSPVFGNGTAFSYSLFGTYSHNNFVELLMNYGIIGFSIYYFPYLILLPRLISQTHSDDLFSLYFLIFVSMQIILGIGWVNYYERVTQLLTVLAVGYSEKETERAENIMPSCKYFKNA